MNKVYTYKRSWHCLLALLCIMTIFAGCASFQSNVVDHSFGFDVRRDNQNAAVLEYWYGRPESRISSKGSRIRPDQLFYFEAVSGPMHRPDALYVKWKMRDDGAIYEDTVDLKSRLPWDVEGKTVYFMIRGSQLYVYLISKERRPLGMAPIGPRMYQSNYVLQIYPDVPKQ